MNYQQLQGMKRTQQHNCSVLLNYNWLQKAFVISGYKVSIQK